MNIADITRGQNRDPRVVKKTRKAITMQLKLDIISRYGNGESLTKIANSLNLNRSTVATILKDKQKILNHVARDTSLLVKSKLVRTRLIRKRPITEKLERSLINWMTEQNLWREPIDKNLIQQKAMNLYEDMKRSNSVGNELPEFKASRGWLERFKRRNEHLVRYDSENPQKVEGKKFIRTLEITIQENEYTNYQVFNVGEMEILWKSIPQKYKSLHYGNKLPNSSDSISVLLGCNAAGECQLTPLLAYHTDTPQELKNITKSSLPVIWSSNQQGIVTKEIFKEWFFQNFIPETKLYCETKKIPFKILLLLSQSAAHPIHLDDFHPDIKVIYIPPNINTALEPMERGIFNMFSNLYLRKLLSNILESVERERPMDLKDFWNSYSVYNCLKNIRYCWDELVTECRPALISTWNKIHTGFVGKFVNPQVVVDSIIQDVVNIDKCLEKTLIANSKQKDEEKNIHGGDNCQTADEIAVINVKEELFEQRLDHSVNLESIEENIVVKEEISELLEQAGEAEEEKTFNKKKMLEAFQKIDDALNIFESMDPNCGRFAEVSKTISGAISSYRKIYRDDH